VTKGQDAEALADQMEKQFPEDTAVRFNYLPTLRAVLALNRAEPQQAVELLQVAAPVAAVSSHCRLPLPFASP